MTLEEILLETEETAIKRMVSSDDLDFSQPYFYQTFVDLQHIDPFIRIQDFGWLATGYDEIFDILKDDRFAAVSPLTTIVNQVFQNMNTITRLFIGPPMKFVMKRDKFVHMTKNWLIFTNPPIHTQVRKLFNQAFTPKRIKEMEPTIRKVVVELLDGLKGKVHFNFITDFAFPLPIIIITDILGIPEDKKMVFKQWSQDMLNGFLFESLKDLSKVRKASRSRKEAIQFLAEILEEKTNNPGNDLISVLLEERKNGLELSDELIIANIIFLLFAGHETTVNLLTNGMYALLKHPDQLKLLLEDHSILPQVIEEMLRFDPSLAMLARIAADDFEFHGKQVTKGDVVNLCLYAANHDEKMFPDSDTFTIGRDNVKRHVAFGQGSHYCLGAPLARMEASVAFELLLPILGKFSLAARNTYERKSMYGFSAFEALWIDFA